MKQKIVWAVLWIVLFGSVLVVGYLFCTSQIKIDLLVSNLWAFPLIVIALSQEKIKNFLYAPKLSIEFALEEPICIKTPTQVILSNRTIENTEAYYFRFKVCNLGSSTARGCECYAEALRINENNIWVTDSTFQPIPLAWSYGRGRDGRIDIHEQSYGVFCDLVHIGRNDIEKKSPDLFIDYGIAVPFSQKLRLSINVKHQVDVVIYSENAKQVKATFCIEFSGQWKALSRDMFKEVLIKKL